MRILIWTQYFWPENFPINELATALREQGAQVTVVTGRPNYPLGKIFPGYRGGLSIVREQFAGVRIIRLPLAPRGSASAFRLLINYLSFVLSGYIWGLRAARNEPFDVVFVYALSPLIQAMPAIPVARGRKAPLVIWVQDLWPESLSATGFIKNPALLRTVEAVVRYIYRRADSLLIQSEAFRDPVARLANDPGKVRYYPNVADARIGSGEAAVQCDEAIEIAKAFSIVFAGNIGTAQSMDTIVEAAALLREETEIRFFIIGGGSREAWLAQEIERRKLDNVLLTGRLPYAAMPAVFAAAAALLVTLGDAPALALTIPSKIQAYLAAGRPVIASVNGEGARVVAEAQAGFTCPAENAEALAATVLRLYRLAPEERSRLGENGRRYFSEHFEQTGRVRELMGHFADIVAQGKEGCR